MGIRDKRHPLHEKCEMMKAGDGLTNGLDEHGLPVINDVEQFLIYKPGKNGAVVAGIEYDVLAEFLIDAYHVLCDENAFYHYDDGIYVVDDGGFLRREIIETLGKYANKHRVEETVYRIKHTKRIQLDYKRAIDQNKYLIPFNNVVYNYKTKEFSTHSPEFFLTAKLSVDYDPEIESTSAVAMLGRIFGDDLAEELEWLGYCLTSTNWLDKMTFYIGDGENGKSIYFRFIEAFFGLHNCCHVSPHTMTTNAFAGVEFENKYLNIDADIGDDKILNFEIIKKFTTIDVVRVEGKGVPAHYIINRAKFLLGGNNMPMIKDRTHGGMRRVRCVVLRNTFKKTDSNYNKDILEEVMTETEMSGLLNVLLASLGNLVDRGFLSGDDMTADRMRRLSQSIHVFGEECLSNFGTPTAFVGTADMYAAYDRWCVINEVPRSERDDFTTSFVAKYHENVEKRPKRHNGKMKQSFVGVELTTLPDDVIYDEDE